MESELIEAAQRGNVEQLLKVVEDNPNVLRAAALEGGETPLHTACVGGHLDFVKQMMILRPEFASELHNGFTPLHIAAALGDVEMVKELVKDDPQLCLIHGRQGKTPLHCAAINGREDVVKELLKVCGDSIEAVTAQGETALHLALNNHHFGTFKCLAKHLKHSPKKHAFNKQDRLGNTILHLAVSLKSFEVIDLLGKEYKDLMDVNSLNEDQMTALDMLKILPSEAGDREIKDKLLEMGGENTFKDTKGSSWDRVEPSNYDFRFKKLRDRPSEVRDALLVIAALIITATYQTALSPPGGLWQDNGDGHRAGFSILLSRNEIVYGFFLFLNSVGFFCSVYIIVVLTAGFPMGYWLMSTLFTLAVAYCLAVVAFIPKRVAPIFSAVCSLLLMLIFLQKITKLALLSIRLYLFSVSNKALSLVEDLVESIDDGQSTRPRPLHGSRDDGQSPRPDSL